jgi:predicted RNA-binding Zn-ribbon protein involved in translation (DUF1610 family)
MCGEENDCGMAKGKETGWCFSVTIPREVLDHVPVEAKDVAYVCRACGETEIIPKRVRCRGANSSLSHVMPL